MKSKDTYQHQSGKSASVSIAGVSKECNTEHSSNIAVAAYYKAQARGFVPGYELEDWLAAETETHSHNTQPVRLGHKATLVPSLQVNHDMT